MAAGLGHLLWIENPRHDAAVGQLDGATVEARWLAGLDALPDVVGDFVELALDRHAALGDLVSRNPQRGRGRARRLFVHYNTLKNRLRLVEEILGRPLDDPDRSLGLALALRIHRLPRA